ncbi:MAG TPA: YciI family protein [Gemmatimonadaceae bacterium]|nr:YciI family protein [Gemmatimonadaceae bacterium]
MTMRYMMFIKHTENYRQEDVPKSLYAAMDEFIGEASKAGAFIDGAGLQPTKNGFRVRLAKGKITTTDGPFTEAKEVVGGYAIMECRTPEEAREYSRKFMELHREHWPGFEGESEVRPFEAEPAAQ